MKVVTGVVGNDIHVVANRLIDISLQVKEDLKYLILVLIHTLKSLLMQ